ncbi:MAG TPA: alpha/beta hydrolase [Steroidobacteraceae bacterium]|jgi:acetyl esterase/lipase
MSPIDKNVDPALWPLVEAFPPIDLGPETLAPFRAALAGMSVMPDASTHPDVGIEELHVPAGAPAAQSIRCLLYRPLRKDATGALLHMHAGGLIMGAPEMDAARNVELVRATGCAILSVEYRLAPEHPYPAALEDCHAALVWFSARTTSFGIASDRIGLIGESAGGGLAAALALAARDRKSAHLTCQVLIYPMLAPPEHSADPSTPAPHTGRYIWTRASNRFAWSAYLSGVPMDKATLAPLVRDVSGLPPTFMAVGDLDLFVHDNLAYVGKLLAAGCSVDAHVYPGAVHGFDRAVEAPVTLRYTRELVGFIQRHLG